MLQQDEKGEMSEKDKVNESGDLYMTDREEIHLGKKVKENLIDVLHVNVRIVRR